MKNLRFNSGPWRRVSPVVTTDSTFSIIVTPLDTEAATIQLIVVVIHRIRIAKSGNKNYHENNNKDGIFRGKELIEFAVSMGNIMPKWKLVTQPVILKDILH